MPETTETVLDETTTAAPETTETVADETTTTETTTTTTEAPEVVEEPVIPEVTLEEALASLSGVGKEFDAFVSAFEDRSHGEYLASDSAINSTHAKNLHINDQRVLDAKAAFESALKTLAGKRDEMTANYEKMRDSNKEYHTKMTEEQKDMFRSDLKDWAQNSKADFDSLMASWTAEEVAETTGGDTPVETVDTAGDTPAEETF